MAVTGFLVRRVCKWGVTGLRGSSLRFPPIKQQSLGSPGKWGAVFSILNFKRVLSIILIVSVALYAARTLPYPTCCPLLRATGHARMVNPPAIEGLTTSDNSSVESIKRVMVIHVIEYFVTSSGPINIMIMASVKCTCMRDHWPGHALPKIKSFVASC